MNLYAWIGEDEHGTLDPQTGQVDVGLKQAFTRNGFVPLAHMRYSRATDADLVAQLQRQADAYGKEIRLVRFTEGEELIVLKPHR